MITKGKVMEDQERQPVPWGEPAPPKIEELELEHVFDENRKLYGGRHGWMYFWDKSNPQFEVLGRIFGYHRIRVHYEGVLFRTETITVNGLNINEFEGLPDSKAKRMFEWYGRDIQLTFREASKLLEYLPTDCDYFSGIPEAQLLELRSTDKDLDRLLRILVHQSERNAGQPRRYDDSWCQEVTELVAVGPKGDETTRDKLGRMLSDAYELLRDQDGRFFIIGANQDEDMRRVDITKPVTLERFAIFHVFPFDNDVEQSSNPEEVSLLAAARFYPHLKFKAKVDRNILAIGTMLAQLIEDNGIIMKEE